FEPIAVAGLGGPAIPPAPPSPPIVVAAPAAPTPAWLEAEAASSLGPYGGGIPLTQVIGKRAAVLEGDLMVAVDHGFVGKMAVPGDRRFVGLGVNDSVYYATSDGSLFRAKDVLAARKEDGFHKVVTIPSVRAWD